MATELPPLLASVKTVGLLEPLHALTGNLFLVYASICDSIAERRWPLVLLPLSQGRWRGCRRARGEGGVEQSLARSSAIGVVVEVVVMDGRRGGQIGYRRQWLRVTAEV